MNDCLEAFEERRQEQKGEEEETRERDKSKLNVE